MPRRKVLRDEKVETINNIENKMVFKMSEYLDTPNEKFQEVISGEKVSYIATPQQMIAQ